MKITECKVNHIKNPLGYDLARQTFSWKYEPEAWEKTKLCFSVVQDANGSFSMISQELDQLFSLKNLKNVQVSCSREGLVTVDVPDFASLYGKSSQVIVATDQEFTRIIHDSGRRSDINCTGYPLSLKLKPCTRYYWKVRAWDKDGNMCESETSWFETGKINQPWQGRWIRVKDEEAGMSDPVLHRSFHLEKGIQSARGYMCGHGLYECYINGEMVNDGYLQPGYHSYSLWQQYETIDLTHILRSGENEIYFLLGRGWYKGRFGVGGGHTNIYGKDWELLCEIHVTYTDGSEEIIASDKAFTWAKGPISDDGIYDGEVYNACIKPDFWKTVEEGDIPHPGQLSERLSLPVVPKKILRPAQLLTDPEGKKILDMGQNITGWIVFQDCLKKGQTVKLQFGELLKDGYLCGDNLGDARQEFIYTSDGQGKLVRPHFTYYGFRYVLLSGFPEAISLKDFQGWSLYSDLETAGEILTGHSMVNQFIKNAMWSQRDNFLDYPSDCPQRSERLGWTGDAQMYCPTACFNMNTAAFYRKYMRDISKEQMNHRGMVPFIIPRSPAPPNQKEEENPEDMTSAAWSDAAVIIPWTLYLYYGDKNLLNEEYPGMKAWVDYVKKLDDEDGGRGLWERGFHFGDWLALDNPEPGPFGLTDKYYIASCYYFYSTRLLSQAAAVLGKEQDEKKYKALSEKIRHAILEKYFDKDQVCKIDTQTGYILAIYMDIVSLEAQKKNGKNWFKKL